MQVSVYPSVGHRFVGGLCLFLASQPCAPTRYGAVLGCDTPAIRTELQAPALRRCPGERVESVVLLAGGSGRQIPATCRFWFAEIRNC